MNQSVAALYDRAFFANQIEGSARSAAVIVPHILELFPKISSIADVGCGAGVWLREFQRYGITRVLGIDGGEPSEFLQIDPKDFLSVDLRTPFSTQEKFDLAICLEVAEHLPAKDAEEFISQLCKLSDTVVFSAAIPGQGGTGHLNERWPSYWASIFAQHRYKCRDVLRSRVWFDARVEWWYAQNILVFTKNRGRTVNGVSNADGVLDLVHPRCFGQFREFADGKGYGKPLPQVLIDASQETISFTRRLFSGLRKKKNIIAAASQPAPEPPLIPYYHPSAPLGAASKYLFVEFPVSHEFLFDVYGGLKGAQLLPVRNNGWWIDDSQYDYVVRSCSKQLEAVFLLTLDRHLYNPDPTSFSRFMEHVSLPVTGILHRFPSTPAEVTALKNAHKWLRTIAVLSEQLGKDVRRLVGDTIEVRYLPHHAPDDLFFWHTKDVRAAIGAQTGDIVVSLIGEARKGKGFDLVLESLPHISEAARDKLFFLFAGKAAAWNREQVQSALDQNKIRGFVDIRDSVNPREFRVMSNQELVDYLCVSDWGLLLYREDQRACASGVLPGYVWARKPVLATKDSIVGREVVRHGLGRVLNNERAYELAALLDQIAAGRVKAGNSQARDRYRNAISRKQVIMHLRQVLESAVRKTESKA